MPSERRADAGDESPAPPRRGRAARIWRRSARVLLGLLVAVLALVVVALVALRTDWARERVRVFALDRLRTTLRGDVAAARLSGDLLKGVTLHDVAIRAPDGEPFLTAERLEVSYDVRGFLRQEVLLGEVVLVRPDLRLVQDSTGVWNLMAILPAPKPSAPPSNWGRVVRIGDLTIQDGDVLVASAARPRPFGPLGDRVRLQEVNGALGLAVERGDTADFQRFDARELSFRLVDAGLTVRQLDGRVERTPDALRVDNFRLRTPATALAADGAVTGGANSPDRVIDLTLRAEPLAFDDVRPFLRRQLPSGTLRGVVRLEGPTDSLSASFTDIAVRTAGSSATAEGTALLAEAPLFEGRLDVDRLDPADARALHPAYPLREPLALRIAADGTSRRTAVNGELTFGATRARFDGTIGIAASQPVYDLKAEVTGLDPQDLMHEAQWAGVVNGSAHVSGAGREAAVDATLRDTRLRGYRIRSASLDGRLAGETLRIDAMRVELPRTVVTASGRVASAGGVDLAFQTTSRDLGDLMPNGRPFPVGTLAASGNVRGTPGRLTADVEAQADSLVVGGSVVDSLSVVASLGGVGGPAPSGTADAVAVGISGPGAARIERVDLTSRFARGTGDVTIEARIDSLRTAGAHAEVRLAGRAPQVVVDSLALAYADTVWRLRDGGRIAYAGNVLRFEDAVLASDGRSIALEGSADLDGALALRFAFDSLSVGELQRLAGREPALEGLLDGSVDLRGTAADPVLDAQLGLRDALAGGLALQTVEGTLAYADRQLRLDVEAVPTASESGEPGRVALRGTVPVDLALRGGGPRFPDAPVDLTLETRALRLATLQPGDSLVSATGPLDAQLRVTGRASAPRLQGSFALARSRVGGLGVERLTGEVSYADRNLVLDAELVPGAVAPAGGEPAVAATAPGSVPGVLRIHAAVPVDLSLGATGSRLLDRPLDVVAEGRGLTLGIVGAFFPAVTEASGPLDLDVRVSGTPSDPAWEGRVALRDGAFRVHQGARYTGVNAVLRFDNDELVLEDVRLSSASGDAAVRGRVELTELKPGAVDAQLTAQNFTLLDEDGKQVIVDAGLSISGTAGAPVVTGSVTVEQMEWPLPEGGTDKDVIDVNDAILYVRAEGDTAAATPTPGVWEEAQMKIDVTIEDDAVLRSSKALIVLAGDLEVTKPRGAARPVVAGDVAVVRGTYRDFGRTFEVTEGAVRFFGTPDLNPGLDVTATTTVKNEDTGADVTVTLEVGGTVEDLQLDLSSAPPFDRSEIVSLLLFGSPTPGAGEENRFESTVTRLAASQAAAPLQGALANELGLDVLEIQPGLDGGGTGFRAGKYVAEDVFVTYSQDAGGDEGTKFGVEYRLTDQVTMRTEVGSQFGVDALYEFTY